MNGFRQTGVARLIRRVSIDGAGNIAVIDIASGEFFGVQTLATTRSRSTRDSASPRSRDSLRIRYLSPPFSPPEPLAAGCRLRIGLIDYELLSDPRDVRVSFEVDKFEVPLLPVGVLYPVTGDLHEMGTGGALVTAEVQFSVYSSDETANDTGIYEDYNSEAPIEHLDTLKVNRELRAGGRIFKIVDASLDRTGAYVKLTLRKTGAAS